VNVVEALDLMRLDRVRAIHLLQDGHHLLGYGNLLADRPVILGKGKNSFHFALLESILQSPISADCFGQIFILKLRTNFQAKTAYSM
jgi:hypothetical protein